MARHKIKSGELPPNYHSTDPRQMSLPMEQSDQLAAGRPAADVPVVTDVDHLAEEIKKLTGCGVSLTWAAPSMVTASQLVLVGWDSLPRMKRDGSGTGRAGFFMTAVEALQHVLEYERLSAEKGRSAAEAFHLGVRCKSEAEAVVKMEERAGIMREDALAKEKGFEKLRKPRKGVYEG